MRIILSTICLMFLMSGITSAFFEEKKSIRILYVIVSMTGVILCVIGFIYADTDSIHCDLPVEKIKGVKLDDVNFLCWKHEASWKRGLFLRQKTYIEETEDGANVTACGMGVRCKELISNCINGTDPQPRNEAEQEFCEHFTKLEDFRIGLKVPSNLKQKRIPGGVVLMEDEFCIR